MIADFVEVKKKLYQVLNRMMVAEMRKHAPLIAITNRHVMHEGNSSSYETVDHECRQVEMQNAGASFSLTRDEMSAITFEEVVEKMKACAADMARQMEQQVFRTLDREIRSAGNAVVAKEFTPATLLEALERIQVDFDDRRDKPSIPSLVLHPDMAKKLFDADRAMSAGDRREFEKKWEAILDRKFEEYVGREGKRKLID